MTDITPSDEVNLDEALAEVRKEFDRGLPERLATLSTALDVLSQSFDAGAAETFFFNAHSLKGTAGAFGADGMVQPAREMADRARQWLKQGDASARGLAAAREELERLREAVNRYLTG